MSRRSVILFTVGIVAGALLLGITSPVDAPAADKANGQKKNLTRNEYKRSVHRVIDDQKDKAKGRNEYNLAVRAMLAKSYQKAITHLQHAVLWDGQNIQYQMALIDAYQKSGNLEQAWDQARQAMRTEEGNPDAMKAFASVWGKMAAKGTLDVGRKSSEVREALGQPDRAEVKKRRVLWKYGFKVIEFDNNRISLIMDQRTPQAANTVQPLRLRLDMRAWSVRMRSGDAKSAIIQYAPKSELGIQRQRVTSQRLLSLAKVGVSVESKMNESIAKLKQAYPDMVVNLIQQAATEAFYDWTSKANGHRHHIVRWIAAGGDIHLISYESTGVKLEKEMRDRWVEMIARVQFAQTARR